MIYSAIKYPLRRLTSYILNTAFKEFLCRVMTFSNTELSTYYSSTQISSWRRNGVKRKKRSECESNYVTTCYQVLFTQWPNRYYKVYFVELSVWEVTYPHPPLSRSPLVWPRSRPPLQFFKVKGKRPWNDVVTSDLQVSSLRTHLKNLVNKERIIYRKTF